MNGTPDSARGRQPVASVLLYLPAEVASVPAAAWGRAEMAARVARRQAALEAAGWLLTGTPNPVAHLLGPVDEEVAGRLELQHQAVQPVEQRQVGRLARPLGHLHQLPVGWPLLGGRQHLGRRPAALRRHRLARARSPDQPQQALRRVLLSGGRRCRLVLVGLVARAPLDQLMSGACVRAGRAGLQRVRVSREMQTLALLGFGVQVLVRRRRVCSVARSW
jgi:hypothetical protein